MKKLYNTILCCTAALMFASQANAGVSFIVQPTKSSNSGVASSNHCLKSGFKLKSCPNNSEPNSSCVFDGTEYFDRCCSFSVYKTPEECAKNGQDIDETNNCAGRYICK